MDRAKVATAPRGRCCWLGSATTARLARGMPMEKRLARHDAKRQAARIDACPALAPQTDEGRNEVTECPFMVRSRYWFTSISVQKKPYRSCTHSKYDTVTPPALHRMSGMTSTPRANNSLSAPGVVGPLAASATILALMRSTLSIVMVFSSAAGASTSHFSSSRSLLEMKSQPGKPTTVPVSSLYLMTATGSRPAPL